MSSLAAVGTPGGGGGHRGQRQAPTLARGNAEAKHRLTVSAESPAASCALRHLPILRHDLAQRQQRPRSPAPQDFLRLTRCPRKLVLCSCPWPPSRLGSL